MRHKEEQRRAAASLLILLIVAQALLQLLIKALCGISLDSISFVSWFCVLISIFFSFSFCEMFLMNNKKED